MHGWRTPFGFHPETARSISGFGKNSESARLPIEAAVRGDAVCMQDLLYACLAEQGGAFGAQLRAERQVGFVVQP